MRVRWIGIVSGADAEGPREPLRHLPGVLGIQIQVQKIVRLGVCERKCLGHGGSHAMDELRQSRISDQRNDALPEVIIIQPEDSGIGSKAKLMGSRGPRQVVVNEKTGGLSSLHPRIIDAADGRKRSAGAVALERDGERGQRRGKIAGSEQTLVPGERRIEVVHQPRGKDVREAGCEGVKRLRRDGVEQRVDGVRVGGLQTGVDLEPVPGGVVRVDVVIDAGSLDLFTIVAGMGDALTIGATVPVGRNSRGLTFVAIERAAQNGQRSSGRASVQAEHLLIKGH